MRGQYGSLVGCGARGAYMRAQVGADAAPAGYDDVFRDQLAKLSALRGVDHVSPSEFPLGIVPRTTFGDARNLIAYWTDELARGAQRSPAAYTLLISPIATIMDTQVPGDLGGLERAVRVWRVEAFLASQLAGVEPGMLYNRNPQLWHAMMTVSTELAALHEAPSKWDLARDAIVENVKKLPGRLATGSKYVLIAAGIIGGAFVIGNLLTASATASTARKHAP
jgi:hypothetical protein